MAQDKIAVSPELLSAKAKEVRSLKAEYDESIRRLSNLVYALDQIWTGESQKAFIQSFEEAKPVFNKFSNGIESYAATMDSTVADMVATDQNIASKNRATLQSSFT